MIKTGRGHWRQFRSRNLAVRNCQVAYQYLNTYAVGGSTGSAETSGDFRLGKYFCPGGAAAMLWSAQPVHRMSVFISVRITIEDYSLTMRKMKAGLHTVLLSNKNFIGAIDSGIIPPAGLRSPRQPSVTETSTRSDICLKASCTVFSAGYPTM